MTTLNDILTTDNEQHRTAATRLIRDGYTAAILDDSPFRVSEAGPMIPIRIEDDVEPGIDTLRVVITDKDAPVLYSRLLGVVTSAAEVTLVQPFQDLDGSSLAEYAIIVSQDQYLGRASSDS